MAGRSRLPKLGTYLAFAFSALSVLLTLLLTLVIERTASEDIAARIGIGLGELASETASRLDRGVFERRREIQLMAARLARIQDFGEVRAELDAAKASYRYYAWLGVADGRGRVQAASGGVLQGADVAHQPWFRLARAGVNLVDVHRAALPGMPHLGADGEPARFYGIAFPLRVGAGAGVLGVQVSWDWARDAREAIFGLGRRGDVEPLIVGADDTVLLGPAHLEGRKLQVGSLARAQGASGYVLETWPDGQHYVVGYARSRGFLSSPGLGWRVLVRQDLDTAYQPLRQLQSRVFFGGLALAIFFSIIGWVTARAVARPLLTLAADAGRLEQGEALQMRPSRAYREVQVLDTALNSMVGRLHQKSGELRTLNAELEQRVGERTAELQQAFDRVQANEHRIQTIIEAAQDPFIGMDMEGRITDWNTQAEVVFGWGREEVIGRQASALLLPPRFAGTLDATLQRFRDTGDLSILNRPLERVMVDRTGREIAVEIRIGLVSTGDLRFFSAFVHDISRRKEVERMKDEFISTVSHELRTPLTAIYGSLDLLASGMAGELPPDAKHLLGISHQSTERLIRLINDMLDLEKIASGKMEYRRLPQPLRPLVEQAVRDTQAYAEGLRVHLQLEPGPDPRADVDSDRIVQVCVNLLSNATKFSPPGATVQVALAAHDGVARISVVDCGPGVPPGFQERIFERFVQVDASDRRAKGGTGLGLAICRSIVEAHGGRIGFASEPGVRTEFYVELPLA
jgi:PAS domain S-box-containing protein